MAQLVKYKYGTYTHEPGEVVDCSYRESANLTKRWYRDTALTEVQMKVELQGCDWGELKGKIDALYNAYTVNERKWVIEDETGADTRWILDPANVNMMRGPVTEVIELPTATMEEMVTIRTFIIRLRALFAAAESQIIYYEDSITHIGTCGPMWRAQPIVGPLAGPVILRRPRIFWVWPWTTQTIIQEGKSLGFEGYYSPDPLKVGGAPPILGINYEHLEKRVDRPLKPQRIGPRFWYYPWEWSYTFESIYNLAPLTPP